MSRKYYMIRLDLVAENQSIQYNTFNSSKARPPHRASPFEDLDLEKQLGSSSHLDTPLSSRTVHLYLPLAFLFIVQISLDDEIAHIGRVGLGSVKGLEKW